MTIAKKLGRPDWWGIVIALVPIVNIIFFLMLVFGTAPAPAPAQTPPKA